MYRIVFMGTPAFSIPTLEALIAAPNMEVVGICTSPDKPVGRKQLLTPSPVKVCATAHGLPLYQPSTMRHNDELYEQLVALAPDFFVVVAYGFIIPKRFLQIPRIMPINIHGSLLPAYRGASPIQASLLNGDSTTGLTYIEMVPAMDAGPMLSLVPYNIPAGATADHLFTALSDLAAQHIVEVVRGVATGSITPIVQPTTGVTMCGKLTKAMGAITPPQETATAIYHKWQAFTSWPGIHLLWQNTSIKILECHVHTTPLTPGAIALDGAALLLGCKTGTLAITRLQIAGKNPIDGATFVRGYPDFSL